MMPKNYKSFETVATGNEVFYYGPGGEEKSAALADEVESSPGFWQKRTRPVEIIFSRMGEHDEHVTDILVRRTYTTPTPDGLGTKEETVAEPPLWEVIYDEKGLQTSMTPKEIDVALDSLKRQAINTSSPNATQKLAVKYDVVDQFVNAGLLTEPTADQLAVPYPYVGAVNGDEHTPIV